MHERGGGGGGGRGGKDGLRTGNISRETTGKPLGEHTELHIEESTWKYTVKAPGEGNVWKMRFSN